MTKTVVCEIDEEVARVLDGASAERGIEQKALVAQVLSDFARKEALRQQWKNWTPDELAKAYEEFAEEDIQLAEEGMEDYVRGLEEEDKA